jgi:hypothetical protein
MASLWPHDSIPRARQTHCFKGSSHLLHIHPSEHRSPPQNPSKFSSLHKLRQASTTLHGQPPENAEATIDVPLNLVPFLKKAYDALKESMTHFLEDSRPDWLLHDFAPYWLPPIARNLGIPSAFFSIFTAACLGFLGTKAQMSERKSPEEFTLPPRWVPFPTTVAFRLFEALKIFDHGISGVKEDVSDFYRFVEVLQGCDVVAVRSCEEFEPEWLRLLEDLHRKPVLPVGQLPTTHTTTKTTTLTRGGG